MTNAFRSHEQLLANLTPPHLRSPLPHRHHTAVRTAGSSQANPFACVASGIAALWGPAHGGATEAGLMLLQVCGCVWRVLLVGGGLSER
jgi:hypothetical protein